MNIQNINGNVTASCSIPDWEEPFTYQQLLAIEAIEAAAYHSPSTSTSTSISASSASATNSSPPLMKKQKPHFIPENVQQDRPISLRRLPTSLLGLSPCQANLKTRYPALRFGGQILYSRTPLEVDKAATELLQVLETRRLETGQVTVGFDIEWRPSFRRGVPQGKVATMQICGDTDHCHVMHIFHSGIPQSLQFLLEDPTLVKAGVGIDNDAVKVFKDYNVSVKAVEDISCLANQKFGGEPRHWSLASLTETVVFKELEKPRRIRLGNWEANMLSKEQLQYAATDAFASWHLYEALKSLPDAVDLRSEKLKGLPV